MRIAQVAPLHARVPPASHGGTERVVHDLVEGLVELGHEITLFATADAHTSATLVPIAPRALRGWCDVDPHTLLAWHTLLVHEVLSRADAFDAIHFHLDYLHLPVATRAGLPHLTTLYGRLDVPGVSDLLRASPGAPLVSVSEAQRAPATWASWLSTVLPGLDPAAYRFGTRGDDYLAFVGRAAPGHGLDEAIAIARGTGLPLKIAVRVDRSDRDWFESTVAPALRDPKIEFLGEIGLEAQGMLLSRARALLFPVDGTEPFGLAMIESMACGTPVVAYRRGSVREIVDHGLTGFLVESKKAAVDAVAEVGRLDRFVCREVFESRFGHRRMARDYEALYAEVARRRGSRPASGPHPATTPSPPSGP